MVSIGVVASFVIALLLWKGVYSSSQPIAEPSAEFLPVRLEDFVPKTCGDKPTNDGFVKWNVLIQTGRVHRRCVGTLISRSFVLTSAKCVKGIEADKITMFLGHVHVSALPLCLDTNRCLQVRAAQVSIHPEYKGKTKLFNVALIKMEVPVIEMDVIQPICLPLNVTVEDISKDNYEDFRPRIKIGRTEMKIACGFSGVPIVVKDRDQRYNIVGLANGGCGPTIESDETPIVDYMPWIISILPNGEKEPESLQQAGSSGGKDLLLPAL